MTTATNAVANSMCCICDAPVPNGAVACLVHADVLINADYPARARFPAGHPKGNGERPWFQPFLPEVVAALRYQYQGGSTRRSGPNWSGFVLGAAVALGAGAISYASYAAAGPASPAVLLWGAVAWGAWKALRSLVR